MLCLFLASSLAAVHVRVVFISFIIHGFVVAITHSETCSYTPQYKKCDCSKMGGVTSEERDLIQVYCTGQYDLTGIPATLPSTLGRFQATSAKIQRLFPASLSRFPRLRDLYLHHCELEHIANGTFVKQQSLEELALRENKIGILYKETFTGLKFLRRLHLNRNRIAILQQGVFTHLQSLVYLDIADNVISVIEDGAFEGLNFLQTIILSGHRLHKFGSHTFGSLPSLYKLDASFGQYLKEVDDRSFAATPDLKRLHLNDNSLQYLPVRSYRSIPLLQELDLSTNNLRFVPSDAFKGMKSLQSLILNSANISFIQNGSFNGLATLQSLYLYDNPLFCDCNLRWLREWLNDTIDLKLTSPLRVKCVYPTRLNGSVLLQQNVTDFKCFCETCQRDLRCSGPTNSTCNCSNGTWTESCDLSCRSSDFHMKCVSADDRCYCNKRSELPACHRNATIDKSIYGKYSCVCNKGFTGDGLTCVDINECLSAPNRCHSNSTECVNTEGSFACVCKPGYSAETADVIQCEPIAVLISVSVINSTAVQISWEAKANSLLPKEASYRLLYRETGQEQTQLQWFKTKQRIEAVSGRYILDGLKPNTNYELKLVLLTVNPDNEITLGSKTFTTADKVVNSVAGSTANLSTGSIAVIVLVLVLLPTAVVFVVCYIYRRRKSRQNLDNLQPLSPPLAETGSDTVRYVPNGGVQLSVQGTRPLTVTSQEPADEWEIPRDWLFIGKRLGEGEFGLVLEGTIRNDKGDEKVAVKTLKEDATRFDYKDMLAELKIFKKVGHHPNIVSLIGACTSLDGPLYIVTEFVGGGDLLKYLRANRRGQRPEYINVAPPVSENDLARIALDVAKGMKHITEKALVHRDLAARNVLLTEDGKAKVADFGLSRSVYTAGIYVKTTGGRLPLKWMSPESIEQLVFTSKSDVWSYGILLWEMVTFGGFPYPEIHPNLLLDKLYAGHRLQKPFHCSDDLYSVMSSCWHDDPVLRPTFEDLCGGLEDMLSKNTGAYVNLDMAEMFQYVECEPGDDMHT